MRREILEDKSLFYMLRFQLNFQFNVVIGMILVILYIVREFFSCCQLICRIMRVMNYCCIKILSFSDLLCSNRNLK